MIKIQTIKSFLGFGDGLRKGEYFYSQGMNHSREGIKPYWRVNESINSGNLAGLELGKWFDQRKEGAANFVYKVAKDGKIYKVQQGFDNWALVRTPTTTNKGNGLIVDQKNRLLYAQTRYLGMFDGEDWTDNWKDFGGDISPTDEWRPMEMYEDWVIIGNKNKIALLNTTDDSLNTNAFSLPDEFVVKAIKSGKNGVLIGANIGSRSVLVLWDCQTLRSIAPWIWVEGNIYGIAKYAGLWIVSAANEIFITNGYTQKHLAMPIDSKIQDTEFGPPYPSGILVKNFYLFINGGYGMSRKKPGLWIYDLRTKLWEFCPVSNFCTTGVSLGALFVDNLFNFYISYQTSIPAKVYIGRVWNSEPIKAFYITPTLGVGDNQKTAEGLILNFAFDLDFPAAYTPDWKVIAGIYNFKKQLWRYGQTTAASTEANKLKINGTISGMNEAEIGDEVTILEGANAGEIRHIIAITGKDTANEVWTLDSNLDNLTEQNVMLNISPFKKISEWIINSLPIKEHYFPIKGSIGGKKFLIKIYLKGSNLTPEISSLSFVFNDLGYL